MRELRNRDPEIYRLITIRTVESRLWITPNSKTRKLIGGIVGRYQEIFGIEIVDQQILGDKDLLECFLYVETNATNHGLIEDPKD
ncbi:MAG: hypothetical protein H6619_03250 [Deltaproteobacteria bacterium]|nr:hypothetical protein [Deltaproteobacteria bacterium]